MLRLATLSHYLRNLKHSPARQLVWAGAAFLMGVAVAPNSTFSMISLLYGATGILLLVIVCWSSIARPLLLIMLALVIGAWRFDVAVPSADNPNELRYYVDQQLELTGVVVAVDERIDQQKLIVKVVASVAEPRLTNGKTLVTTGLWPKYRYGDEVKLNCLLEAPPQLDDFDYARYLERFGVSVICSRPKVSIIDRDRGNVMYAHIMKMRTFLTARLRQSMSDPHESIIEGMILGNARGIPADVANWFSVLGLTHIIAISGAHITVLVSIVQKLLTSTGLRRQRAFWVTILIVAGYVMMSGGSASAVRAAVMGILVLVAQQLGRLPQQLSLVMFGAALMIMYNPFILMADIGFQLSFLSVVGLLYLSPIITEHLGWITERFQLREMIAMTLSAQFTTLPITLYNFNQLSLLSLPANILILPVGELLMISGAITVLAAGVWLPLGQLAGAVSWVIVSYWLVVSQALASIPLASVTVPKLPAALIMAMYGLLYTIWRRYRQPFGITKNSTL